MCPVYTYRLKKWHEPQPRRECMRPCTQQERMHAVKRASNHASTPTHACAQEAMLTAQKHTALTLLPNDASMHGQHKCEFSKELETPNPRTRDNLTKKHMSTAAGPSGQRLCTATGSRRTMLPAGRWRTPYECGECGVNQRSLPATIATTE